VVQPQWHEDDDALQAQLRVAMAGAGPPQSVLAAAKAVYAWRTVDAELAELAHDSALDEELTVVRSETAAVRTVSFECGALAVELRIADNAMVGQLDGHHRGPRAGSAAEHGTGRRHGLLQARDGAGWLVQPARGHRRRQRRRD